MLYREHSLMAVKRESQESLSMTVLHRCTIGDCCTNPGRGWWLDQGDSGRGLEKDEILEIF